MSAIVMAMVLAQQSMDARINQVLANLSLEQKITVLGGIEGFNVREIPGSNLPVLRMADGPVGVRNFGPAIAYPAGVTLAAAWNPSLARRFGEAIGNDSRAWGVHFWLGPGINLSRVPQNGRNFEYLGEDPFLAGIKATRIVQGVQSKGVAATVKHFAGNEHEMDRNRDNSVIDERTLRELYLRPFEMAIREGGAWAVMTGYNLLNGTYCSENRWLLTDVLRTQWGFRGVVMSDWGATHSAVESAIAGLDLEMPSARWMTVQNLVPAIQRQQLGEPTIDEKVRRILRVGYSLGWDRREQRDASIPIDNPASARVALDIARQGLVLLRNEDGFLPLDRNRVRRVLVVGPNARPTATGGGGSSFTNPIRREDLPDAIQRIGGSRVQVETIAVPNDFFEREWGGALRGPGGAGELVMEVFANRDFSGQPILRRTASHIDFDWASGSPDPSVPNDNFAVRWTGTFVPNATGQYKLTSRTDDGCRVWIDDQLVFEHWSDQGATTRTAMMDLVQGRTYRVRVEYYEGQGLSVAQVAIGQNQLDFTEMIPGQKLREADVVVLALGLNASMESEGFDREFELPAAQQHLLDYVTQHTDNTVAVLYGGAGFDIARWNERFAGLFFAGYPGMNGNQAIAEALFGVINPSGRLPFTMPVTLRGTYYEHAYPSVNRMMVYREGLLMGYRWFDRMGRRPLYPFGFGLSYTTFAMSGIAVTPGTGNQLAQVSVQVTNAGRVQGDTVVQVYLGRPDATRSEPVRDLRAFQRVRLRAGESRRITIPIRRSDAAVWSSSLARWVNPAGTYRVWAGFSSGDLPLEAALRVR